MKIRVSENLCIGCGACQALAADVFEINDNGVSEVIKEPTEDNQNNAKDAADACPTNAISIEE